MNDILFLNDSKENPSPLEITQYIHPNYINNNSLMDSNENNNIPAFEIRNWSMIYFQHVRKSAGTAMVNLFRWNGLCNINGSCNAIKAKYGVTLSFKEMKELHIDNGIRIIINEYYPFYLSSYLKWRNEAWNDILLVTIFRDPLQRIFSDLMYDGVWSCKGKEIAYKYDGFLWRCARDFRVKYTSNVYSKVYSGSWQYAMPYYNLNKTGIDYNRNHEIDHVQYEIAKTIIKQFDIIIILELWQETNIQLKCHGITDMVEEFPHKNRGARKSKRNSTLQDFPILLEKLIEWNQYDIKLYEFAKELALQKAQHCEQYLFRNATSL